MRLSPLRFSVALVSLSVMLFAADSAQAQATIHVPADQPNIQAGINAANNGDTVLVAPGTYYENIDFKGKAITVTSSGSAANTIIDGGGTLPVAVFHTSEVRSSVLSGFTLRNGANGVLVEEAGPTIQNNTISGNACDGIFVDNANPLVTGNEISGTVVSFANSTPSIASNCLGYAAGIDLAVNSTDGGLTTQIIGNTIENNTVGISAGGIDLEGANGAIIARNIIRFNTGASSGGIDSINTETISILGNLIYGNTSLGASVTPGGGIGITPYGDLVGTFLGIIAGNTIADNTVLNGPAGQAAQNLAIEGDLARYVVINNVIAGSSASVPSMTCGEIYNNLASTPVVFDHNDIYNPVGPAYGGACPDQTGTYGNISVNPNFTAPGTGTYTLAKGSAAIDAGNNSAPQLLPVDLVGSLRIQDASGLGYPVVDMGAYEVPATGAPAVGEQSPTILTLTPSNYYALFFPYITPFFLTAQASSAAGIPTGQVTFFEDLAVIGTANLDGTGTAVLQPKAPTPGVHAFVATYPGQTPFSPAVSVKFYVLFPKYTPTITITSSPNPSLLGSPVLFTVTITSPDGTVLSPVVLTDTDTHTVLATLTPNSAGMATYTTSSLPLGYSDISATYAGDATHESDGASVQQFVVNGYATSTSLTCSPAPIGVNATTLCSIKVSSANGTPTGSVTLTDNGNALATLPLIAGSATYVYTGSTDGSHILTAAYPVTGTFSASSATFSLAVNGLPTTTTLTINPMTATAGNPVTLAATVAPVTPIANPLPTGSVSFNYTIGSSHSIVALGSFKLTGSGTVSLTVSSLPAGSLHFTCTYSGDTTFASSSCTPGSITITAPPVAPTSLTLGSSANPSADLAPVTFTAQLTGNGTPLANASVALVVNTQSIQLVTDANGSASYTTSTLPVGSTTVTANYAGTPVDAAAAASLVQQVLAPTFDFSLAAANPTITLQTGHHGTLPLTLTSIGGFRGSVSIGCTGPLPPYVTCELPSSMALSAAASAPVPFTLDTDAVLNFYASERAPASGSPPIALAMLLPFAVLGFAWRRGSRSTLARCLLALLPVCLLAIGLSGCNGFYPASTPPGTYVISVAATGNSQGSPVTNTHTLQVTLIVTP